MRIDIITVLPDLLVSPLGHSIMQRAQNKGLAKVFVHDLRPFGKGNYRQIDDYGFGGDAGMILMVEPLYNIISSLQRERSYDELIYLTPDGELFDQPMANRLSCLQNIILLCGHYKGIDHRIREHLITKEISIGDYVLSGGELAAAVVTDAVVRLLPGVLSDETSALSDSFQDGLLAPPIYSRPAQFREWKVPEVLLSGNPKLIKAWQEEQAVERTKKLRPRLLDG
ncbi:MAG: tRNA (guanosine(37)-N1)-methyltransferase TrmD [Bacteroidales bacterium]|nr:tRNA (guanosine(37)-N1)-methyltransferase TrmD [Bacteroidales bacterium]MCL2738304.1 tRNA (guanosine(37)-N1)-methyltransferase TrmD [Bacteroidales bacterium]